MPFDKDIRERFQTLAPSPEALEQLTESRERFAELAVWVNGTAPESREKSLALTALEEAKFWANQSIVRADNAETRLTQEIEQNRGT